MSPPGISKIRSPLEFARRECIVLFEERDECCARNAMIAVTESMLSGLRGGHYGGKMLYVFVEALEKCRITFVYGPEAGGGGGGGGGGGAGTSAVLLAVVHFNEAVRTMVRLMNATPMSYDSFDRLYSQYLVEEVRAIRAGAGGSSSDWMLLIVVFLAHLYVVLRLLIFC